MATVLRICTHCAASTQKSPTLLTSILFGVNSVRNFIVTSTEQDETPKKLELRLYLYCMLYLCVKLEWLDALVL